MRAADSLGYAQSTITLHLHELESAIGAPLFERRGRRLHLTEAGQTFHQKAAQVLRQVEHLQVSMQDLLSGEGGEVRFAAIEPTLSVRLPPVIAAYSQARPKVRLVLESGSTSGICQRVSANELDFGVCGPPDAHLDLAFEPLFTEQLILLLPEDNPLAQLPSLNVSDLVGQHLLLSGPSCVYRGVLEREFLACGVNIYNQIEASEVETLKHLVQHGVGVAVVPRVSVLIPPERTVTRSIHGVTLSVSIGIARRQDDFTQGRAYADLLRAIREQLGMA